MVPYSHGTGATRQGARHARRTRREFTRHALRSLTALALIEGLAAHRLFGADVEPLVDDWFKELERDQPGRAKDHKIKDIEFRSRSETCTAGSTCPPCSRRSTSTGWPPG